MSRGKKLLLIAAILGVVIAVVFGVSAAARFYLGGAEQQSVAAVCGERHGMTHTLIIADDRLNKTSVSANLCDELVIISQDSAQRRLAFGSHRHHSDYDGADGRLIGRDEKISLVLSKRGEFSFHDHFDDAVHGHFTVK